MALIKIGGVDMPAPARYVVTLSDYDSENTTRNESGYMTRDRVRAGAHKIELEWVLTQGELVKLTKAISPSRFSVTFFDACSGSNKTANMYVGDRTCEMLKYDNTTWWRMSCNFIEY